MNFQDCRFDKLWIMMAASNFRDKWDIVMNNGVREREMSEMEILLHIARFFLLKPEIFA